MRKAMTAVLEHHFDNHQYCSDWCKSAKGAEEEIRESGIRFRYKERKKDLYLLLKKHHDKSREDT